MTNNARYEWFKSIGSPKYVVAPMVDQSDLAFRLMTRKYGADLCYTQMLNVPTFLVCKEYREENLQTSSLERPLFVQIAGHNPEEMLKVGMMIQDMCNDNGEPICDAIDINLGCPQGIAKRGRYGAFLMEELELLTEIVSLLSKKLRIPVTCKTRIYKDFNRSIKLCETLVNAGASLLTIHGRTRESKGEFTGAADWDMIRRIKEHFNDRIPIYANGGISSLEDVKKCMEYTGCDGVMSSEAILENPAVFVENNSLLNNSNEKLNNIQLAEEYLDYAEKFPPRGIRIPRAHLLKILFRYIQYPGMTHHRDRLVRGHSIEELREICVTLKNEITDYEMYDQPGLTWYTRYLDGARLHCGDKGKVRNQDNLSASKKKQQEDDEEELGIFALGFGDDDDEE